MPSNKLTRDIRPYQHLRTTDDTPSKEIRRAWGKGDGEPHDQTQYTRNRRSAPIYTGQQWVGGVDYRFRPVTDAMSYLMRRHAYVPVLGNWGGFRRKVRGGTNWSTHAFLCAVDTHAPQNPMSKTFVTDMPVALIEDWLSIKTVDGNHRAVMWGGFWARSDAMHVNANTPPDALLKGVRCSDGTVFTIGGGVNPTPTRPTITGVYGIGSKAGHVFEIQRLLITQGHLPAGADDGAFGPATEAAVAAWQKRLGLTADGIWGPATEAATRQRIEADKTKPPAEPPVDPKPTEAMIKNKAEATRAVEWAYRRALDRAPDPRSLTIWVDRVLAQTATPDQIHEVLTRIPEGQEVAKRRAAAAVDAVEDAVVATYVARHGEDPTHAQVTYGTTFVMSGLEELKYT